jgi:hypothetical protein
MMTNTETVNLLARTTDLASVVFTVTARRFVHRPMHSGHIDLAVETAATLGEANALAIELADVEGAEEVTITRPALVDQNGREAGYCRVIDLCPIEGEIEI